jgi:hypothetical protein
VKPIRSLWLRIVLWIVGGVAIIAAAAYAIGGRQLLRNLLSARSRAAAMLQPPSPAELQSAAAASPTNTTSVSALPQVPPVSIGHILLWVSLILVSVVVLFYATGRPRRRANAGG